MNGRLLAAGFLWGMLCLCQADSWDCPEPIEESDFATLLDHSPFSRLVSLEDVYVLRAVASVGPETYVTLHNRVTKENVIVTQEEEGPNGMCLVAVHGGEPESLEAIVSYGDSEVRFTYQSDQLEPTPRQGLRDTIRYDNKGRPMTTVELVQKFQTLSNPQRQIYLRWREHTLLKKRPDLRYSPDRFPIAHEALDAIKRGELPPNP